MPSKVVAFSNCRGLACCRDQSEEPVGPGGRRHAFEVVRTLTDDVARVPPLRGLLRLTSLRSPVSFEASPC